MRKRTLTVALATAALGAGMVLPATGSAQDDGGFGFDCEAAPEQTVDLSPVAKVTFNPCEPAPRCEDGDTSTIDLSPLVRVRVTTCS